MGKTVLVIDDDPDIRETLGEILTDEGYAVAAAANGHEAIQYLRSAPRPPDLILLDLMMPVMNGWQFRALQREDERLADIPVLVISATSNLVETAADIAPAAFLQKPIRLDALLEEVARHAA